MVPNVLVARLYAITLFFKGVDFALIEKKQFLVPVPQWTPLPPIEDLIAKAPAPALASSPSPAAEVVNTPITQQHLPGEKQKMFDGFSYCEDPLNVRGGGQHTSLKSGLDT
eukprot:PhF_6_TR38931/c0_g1_i1/m.58244